MPRKTALTKLFFVCIYNYIGYICLFVYVCVYFGDGNHFSSVIISSVSEKVCLKQHLIRFYCNLFQSRHTVHS